MFNRNSVNVELL